MQGVSTWKSVSVVIHYISKLKKQNRKIISVEAEEAFDKIQLSTLAWWSRSLLQKANEILLSRV